MLTKQISSNCLKLFMLMSISCLFIIVHKYVYHNDLGFWCNDNSPFAAHAESGHLIFFGRPLGAMLLNLQTILIRNSHTIYMINIVRVISIILFLGLACLVDYTLIKYTILNKQKRFLLITIMFIHPSWFISLIWASNLLPGIGSYILGLLAALSLQPFSLNSEVFSILNKKRILLASLLLVSSFYIYPAGALAFFWLPLICWSIGSHKLRVIELLKMFVFFGIVCSLGLLIHYLILKPILCHVTACTTWIAPDSTEYSLKIVSDIFAKILVLWNSVAIVSGSWFLFFYDTPVIAALIGFAFIIVAVFPSPKNRIFSSNYDKLISISICCIFFLTLNLHNLITNSSVVAFRTVSPLTILLAIGSIKLINLIPNKKSIVLEVFIAIFLGVLSTISTIKIIHIYQKAYSILQLQTECHTKIDTNDPRFSAAVGLSALPKDFGLNKIVPWAIPCICQIMPLQKNIK